MYDNVDNDYDNKFKIIPLTVIWHAWMYRRENRFSVIVSGRIGKAVKILV